MRPGYGSCDEHCLHIFWCRSAMCATYDPIYNDEESPGEVYNISWWIFSYKLRYIVGLGLVEMTISTNQKSTIYRNLHENTDPGDHSAGGLCGEHWIISQQSATCTNHTETLYYSRSELVWARLDHHDLVTCQWSTCRNALSTTNAFR